MKKKILVAVGLGKNALDLVSFGCSMADCLDAQVDFLHVLPPIEPWMGYKSWIPPETIAEAKKEAKDKLSGLVAEAVGKGTDKASETSHTVFVEQGNASEEIIERAKKGNYTMIIVGYKDKADNTLVEIVIGSTAASVVRFAPCSVLIYRRGLNWF